MTHQPEQININKSVLADFADVAAGLVRRNREGRDIRRSGRGGVFNGQIGGKMAKYAEAGLCTRRGDGVWEMTELGDAEAARARAEYDARKIA